MRWTVRRLDEIPLVPRTDEDDPAWRPLQHFFGLTAFGANVFVAPRGDETLVEEHDERASGQEELYLVLEGEAEFEVGGETFVAGRGTVVALTDPTVRRRTTARTAGTSLLVVGSRPGCFETTWRASHFAEVPRAGQAGESRSARY
jgi:quercetin dioxygenase-like cupin family protein